VPELADLERGEASLRRGQLIAASLLLLPSISANMAPFPTLDTALSS
jgi:hypothetical protein